MRFKSLYPMISIILMLCSVGYSHTEKVRYQIQVYRLADGFNLQSSLDKEIWQLPKEKWHKISDAVTLLDQGSLCWHKNAKLKITPQELLWNQKTLDPQNQKVKEKFKLIYNPDFIKKTNDLARLKIEAKTPFQYMLKREDGLFELDEIALPVGLDLEIKAVKRSKDVYLISYLEIELRTVGKREAVPDVNLDIGKPILQEWEYKMSLEVKAAQSYNVLLKPKGISGAVLIRIRIDKAE